METRQYSRHKYPPVNNVMVSLFLAGGSGGDLTVLQAQVSSSPQCYGIFVSCRWVWWRLDSTAGTSILQ